MPIFFLSPKVTALGGALLLLGGVAAVEIGSATVADQAGGRLLTAGISRSSKADATRASASARAKVQPAAQPPAQQKASRIPQITVTKSGASAVTYNYERKAAKSNWHFLGRSVRAKIDAAKVVSGRWKMMVLHSSGTSCGSADAFDYYHRNVKHMQHGLAYHFVIGNGHGSGDGEIQVGPRWTLQEAGGHLRSGPQNEIALGICLVGNFEKGKPSEKQVEALDELLDYLQAKVGKVTITTHRLINIRPTLCPGKNFPAKMFVEP